MEDKNALKHYNFSFLWYLLENTICLSSQLLGTTDVIHFKHELTESLGKRNCTYARAQLQIRTHQIGILRKDVN